MLFSFLLLVQRRQFKGIKIIFDVPRRKQRTKIKQLKSRVVLIPLLNIHIQSSIYQYLLLYLPIYLSIYVFVLLYILLSTWLFIRLGRCVGDGLAGLRVGSVEREAKGLTNGILFHMAKELRIISFSLGSRSPPLITLSFLSSVFPSSFM